MELKKFIKDSIEYNGEHNGVRINFEKINLTPFFVTPFFGKNKPDPIFPPPKPEREFKTIAEFVAVL